MCLASVITNLGMTLIQTRLKIPPPAPLSLSPLLPPRCCPICCPPCSCPSFACTLLSVPPHPFCADRECNKVSQPPPFPQPPHLLTPPLCRPPPAPLV